MCIVSVFAMEVNNLGQYGCSKPKEVIETRYLNQEKMHTREMQIYDTTVLYEINNKIIAHCRKEGQTLF